MLSRLTGLSAMLIVLVWLTGCVPKIVVPKFDSQQLNPKLDKIFEIDKMDCGMLRDKKVFTSFTGNTPSKEFLEDMAPTKKVEKYKYTGNLAEDIKKKLDSVLTTYCGAKIANTTDDSDIALNGAIEKFYSQILEYKEEKVRDDGFRLGVRERHDNIKKKAATILSITNKFGNSDWKYEHLLALNENTIVKFRHGYYVFFSTLDIAGIKNNRLVYDDDITIALESDVGSSSQAPLMIGVDSKSKIEIYDINTRKLKEEIMLNKEDIDLWWGGPKNPEIRNIEGLYFSTPGNFKILIYNYIKEIISKLNVSMSNK